MESIVSIKDCNIYIDKHLVLKDVNFDINKGEFIYLIGKTGTGKSSLLKTLYGEIEMTEGEGRVGGDGGTGIGVYAAVEKMVGALSSPCEEEPSSSFCIVGESSSPPSRCGSAGSPTTRCDAACSCSCSCPSSSSSSGVWIVEDAVNGSCC